MRPTKLLIIDFTDSDRAALAAAAESSGQFLVCGAIEDTSEGLNLATLLQPDAVVMDSPHIYEGGFAELITRLRAAVPQATIAVYTLLEGEHEQQQALDAGAAGYFFKDTDSVGEVLSTLRPAGR